MFCEASAAGGPLGARFLFCGLCIDLLISVWYYYSDKKEFKEQTEDEGREAEQHPILWSVYSVFIDFWHERILCFKHLLIKRTDCIDAHVDRRRAADLSGFLQRRI